MKKEKQEIGSNTSSGAEKVENVTKQTTVKKTGKTTQSASKPTAKETAKGEAALGSAEKKTERVSAKKINAQSAGSKAEKESAAAKARVEKALQKKEEKAKKKAERLARAQKKKEERAKKRAEFKKQLAAREAEIEQELEQRKANMAKRAAEKKALAEKRAAEREEKIRKRAHEKANRNKARAQKRAETAKRKQQKNQTRKGENSAHRREEKGYGGWLAAVVSLGVLTLALATTVTVGALDMRKNARMLMGDNRRAMYELTGIMENVDSDLERARISASSAQQSRILTDLLVQARLAELDLEKMPISAEADANVTTFINRTARECERMLAKLRMGESLSASDYEILEGLYKTNHQIRLELDELTARMTDDDWKALMKKGKGRIGDAIGRMEKMTLEENRLSSEAEIGEMTGAGMERNSPAKPKDKNSSHIDPARAEELCMQYFPKYNISEYRCVGETVTKDYCAYNVQGYDDKGTQLFAEISQKDGTLLRFDYYEDCMGDTFDFQNAKRIAEEFLEGLGYDDMEVVRLRENGSTVDFTFVYEDDDVVFYPDQIRVKVCRTRGIVTGLDTTEYVKNHKKRKAVDPKVSLAAAYDKLHDKLTVESARLAVVDTERGEKAAYEFLCSYGEEKYFVFIDAMNGEEIAIVNTRQAQ